MKGVPSAAAVLYLVLIAGLMPTAFLFQGPGSHNAFVQLFCCFSRLWWSCLFAREDSARSIAAALDPTPTRPQIQQESLGSNTWTGQRREAVDAQVRAVILEQDQPERER